MGILRNYLAVFLISVTVTSLSDPVKIPLDVLPSAIKSTEKGLMNITPLHLSIRYQVLCNLKTNQDNDPFYVQGGQSGGSDVQWMVDYHPNVTTIPKAGDHVLSIDVVRNQQGSISSLYLLNASMDTISIGNCVAAPE